MNDIAAAEKNTPATFDRGFGVMKLKIAAIANRAAAMNLLVALLFCAMVEG